MVFKFKQVVVSGTLANVEGVSAALSEISTFMQDCGWSLVDDRSAEPGTNVSSTHMKYVFSSNGEEGNYPTFFATLYSGISALAGGSTISFDVHTAYDVGSHIVPSSGVSTIIGTGIGSSANSLNVRSTDDDTELYLSGDSEMVHIITRRVNDNSSANTMDNSFFGRFNSFMALNENPYPLLINGANGTTITTASTSSVRGIGGNPPMGFDSTSKMEVLTYPITDAQGPYNLGVTSIFFAGPMIVTYDNSSPISRGIAGTVRNGWSGQDATNLLNLSILTASGTFGVQEYQSFCPESGATTDSIIVRKS